MPPFAVRNDELSMLSIRTTIARRICVELYKVIAELRLACLSLIAPTAWRRELITGVGESLAGSMLAMDLANMTFVRFFDCEFTLH